jgi:hypothetical protein
MKCKPSRTADDGDKNKVFAFLERTRAGGPKGLADEGFRRLVQPP